MSTLTLLAKRALHTVCLLIPVTVLSGVIFVAVYVAQRI